MNDSVNAVAAMAAPAPASPKRGDDPPTDAFETALGSAAATESPPGTNATKARTADAGGSKAEGDSSGLTDTDKLGQLYEFFHPHLRDLHPSGRIVVLGTRPAECTSTAEGVAQLVHGDSRLISETLIASRVIRKDYGSARWLIPRSTRITP